MSASESKTEAPVATLTEEGDNVEFGYDHGGVPLYIAIAWVLFLAFYVVYMVIYALPDLSAWGAL